MRRPIRNSRFDPMTIIIIGAGPGGYETALAARRQGLDVILVESGQVGGTCLNAGCIPTKAYCRTAEILEEMRHAGAFGISAGQPTLDFAQVKRRKDDIVSGLRSNVETLLESSGVQLVRGQASFKDHRTVTVCGTDYTADYIIIAAGSVPAVPDIPGIGLDGVVDSTALLELEELPRKLCIIGGGVIGLEFASVFRSFGSEVTVVEFCREVLPRYDQDIAKRLRQSLSKRGIVFSLQSAVTSIEEVQETGLLRVNWEKKGVPGNCEADHVLVAVGRRPDSNRLDTEAAGLVTERGAVVVDGDMRTNVPHIFAIGDVNGRQLLAHAATFQGKVALQAIMSDMAGQSPEPVSGTGLVSSGNGVNGPDVMPSAVFTMPEAASVGYAEEDCKSFGLEYSVHKAFFRANGKAVCMGETDGLCKILSSPEGKILGCHVVGPHAADLVQEVSSLMSAGADLDAIRHAVHIHPTLGEVISAAAES